MTLDQLQRQLADLKRIESSEDSLSSLLAAALGPTAWIDPSGLPVPVATAQTDADGKFTIMLPRGRQYAIIATAMRLAGDSTETLTWIVRVDPEKDSTIRLANSNVIATRDRSNILGRASFDSLVRPVGN